jgi:hypothetical protein
MARVKYPHRGGYGSSGLDRARAVRKKKPYKVVLEIVTEEKKKLRSVVRSIEPTRYCPRLTCIDGIQRGCTARLHFCPTWEPRPHGVLQREVQKRRPGRTYRLSKQRPTASWYGSHTIYRRNQGQRRPQTLRRTLIPPKLIHGGLDTTFPMQSLTRLAII